MERRIIFLCPLLLQVITVHTRVKSMEVIEACLENVKFALIDLTECNATYRIIGFKNYNYWIIKYVKCPLQEAWQLITVCSFLSSTNYQTIFAQLCYFMWLVLPNYAASHCHCITFRLYLQYKYAKVQCRLCVRSFAPGKGFSNCPYHVGLWVGRGIFQSLVQNL